jgi:ESX secretion system protein EccD
VDTGLLRVTVASATRRVDLLLPGAWPLTQMLPELARGVGVLDAATVYGGHRVVTIDGRELDGDLSLTAQGIEDGAILTVTARADDVPRRVHDDEAEAMAEVVAGISATWSAGDGLRAAGAVAASCLALGVVGLAVHGSARDGVVSAAVATLLVAGGIVDSRTRTEPTQALALIWLGAGYAGAAGPLLSGAATAPGAAVAHVGVGMLVAGMVAAAWMRAGRILALPAVLIGLVLVAAGAAVSLTGLDRRIVMAVVLAAAALIGVSFPRMGLAVATARLDRPGRDAGPGELSAVDLEGLACDARLAQELLLALSATVGVLVVALGPVVATRGPEDALVAGLCCVVVLLRSRRIRVRAEAWVGVASGAAGILEVAVVVLWMHDRWRPWVTIGLVAAGVLAMVVVATARRMDLPGRRLAGLAEGIALLALLPSLLVATGAVETAATWWPP